MEHMKRVNLYEIMQEIAENTIVLPDFQRGFAWKDKKKQTGLLASVLTRLPIGTVLFLDVEAKEYGYKKIGRNERNIITSKNGKSIKALLDGQQRITTLLAYFSTKLQEEEEDLISPTLNRRYFLNLPGFWSVMENGREDIFGGSLLKIPVSLENGNYPEVSSEDMRSCITFVTERQEFLYQNVSDLNTENICNYCRDMKNSEDGSSYLIPLYYLLGACDKNSRESVILNDVVRTIGEEYKNSIITWFQDDRYSIGEKEAFLEKLGIPESLLEKAKKNLRDQNIAEMKELLGEELSERKGSWKSGLISYLLRCIEEIGLYEIRIKAKDKKRAIDIYENLNLGGKALSVFDLILAKASKETEEKKQGNLMTQIVEDIESDHRKDYLPFIEKCERKQKNSYKNNVMDKGFAYSASKNIGCWDSGKKELYGGYSKALMNLLGIIHYFSDGKEDLDLKDQRRIHGLNTQVMKKEYLLNEIPSEKISGYMRKACQGLDRAGVFLQVRCGIRKASEIHYNLMWVVLGTVFLRDEWFFSGQAADYMEAWYWSAILSGAFKIEQNRAFIESLRKILSEIQTLEGDTPKKEFVTGLCEEILQDKKFADKEILLMENPSVYPEEVIGNTICQYYLANIYQDILKEIPGQSGYKPGKLEALNRELKLEKHHLVPVGGLDAKYKDAGRKMAKRRRDPGSLYNSPLNYLYISEQANALISNNILKSYIEYCDSDALKTVGIDQWDILKEKKEVDFQIEDGELRIFLERRYENFKHSLSEKCKALLNYQAKNDRE